MIDTWVYVAITKEYYSWALSEVKRGGFRHIGDCDVQQKHLLDSTHLALKLTLYHDP